MIVARRTFLLGLASALAVPMLPNIEKILGPVSTGILDPHLGDRLIARMSMSAMPTGEEIRSANFREEPVRYEVLRGDETVFHVMLNPRAHMQWVSMPGEEIVVPANKSLRMVIEPCYTNVALTIVSNIEKDWRQRPRFFSECFHWKDGKVILSSVAAMNPADENVLIDN